MSDRYVLLKRDLFECPEHKGYTGVRDRAGVWSCERLPTGIPIRATYDRWSTEHYALPLEAAPEFTQACYEDVARNYLRCQRDDANTRIAALEAQLAERVKVKVKPLRWGEYAALNRGRKLVAHDCFGNEFARLDLKENQTVTSVLIFKAEHEERYTRLILSTLEATPPAPKVTEAMTIFDRHGLSSLIHKDQHDTVLAAIEEALTAAQEAAKP